MQTKHTPGPWETETSIRGNTNVFKPKPDTENDSWQICTVYPLNFFESETEDANAKLIAAAPELLEALIIAKNIIQANGISLEKHYKSEYDKIVSAINKATL